MVARLTIEQMHEVAKSRGGRCISETYCNTMSKLLWECAAGHRWKATPNEVKDKKRWCPVCGGTAPLTIEEMREIAERRGGRCLSREYTNNKTKLRWQCAEEHKWEAIPNDIKRGSWCPSCAGKALLTIDEMHELAKSRGGRCLSETYGNGAAKLRWECAAGHCWASTSHQVKAGHWCAVCAGNAVSTIDEMHELASGRGGRCLSDTYCNALTKLLWQCANGHCWAAVPSSIKRGSWCPVCAVETAETGTGERLSVDVLRKATGLTFQKVRPAWLVNTRGSRLELDAYCDERKLAFEYQGAQHHRYIPLFHGTRANFAKRRRHDSIKRKLCAEHGVLLIQMPEVKNPTEERVRAALVRLCEAMAFPIELNPEYAAMVGASRAHMDSETPTD